MTFDPYADGYRDAMEDALQCLEDLRQFWILNPSEDADRVERIRRMKMDLRRMQRDAA